MPASFPAASNNVSRSPVRRSGARRPPARRAALESDVRLRVEMREEVRKSLKRAGVTAISVTHDQEEALSISDRVAIMNDGTIAQIGDPAEVFENPESRFVASFLGQASFLSARVTNDRIETGLGSFNVEY